MSGRTFSLVRGLPSGAPGLLRLELHGTLDSQDSSNLPQALLDAIRPAAGVWRVELGLSGLAYASSTGIGSLITGTLQLRRNGIELSLTDTPSHIMGIIDLLGFSSSLHFGHWDVPS